MLAKNRFPLYFRWRGGREAQANSTREAAKLAKMSGPAGFMVSEVRMGFPHRSRHSVGQLLPRFARRQLNVRTPTIRSHLRQPSVIGLECLSSCTMDACPKVASLLLLPECLQCGFVSPFL